ncbi:MAG: hypothetical protein GF347_02345, partial [Candidatus Moranbacteria bacterium]|nr:hypothetical protein [Candidatus Moranbacteria bacterium]
HIGMFDALIPLRLLPKKILKFTTIPAATERWEKDSKIISFIMDFFVGAYPFANQGPWIKASMEATGELADQAYTFVIAPEGRFQRENRLQPFQTGLGFLAKELKLPVIMVKIDENYREIWPSPKTNDHAADPRFYKPLKKSTVKIKIKSADINPSLSEEKLTKNIQKQFENL